MTAYRRDGLPRIVLFFNRDIAEITAASPILRQSVTITGIDEAALKGTTKAYPEPKVNTDLVVKPLQSGEALGGDQHRGLDAVNLETSEKLNLQKTTEISVSRVPVGSRQQLISEAQEWLLESGFTTRMGTEGARLLDRATAIRLMPSGSLDPQLLETEALRSQAEIAVVIRAAPLDPAGPRTIQNLLFTVMAVKTRNGQILVDRIVRPEIDAGAVQPPEVVGQAIAAELVASLISYWSQAK